MSVLLFSLRGVPDDEAWEVRTLLADNEIEFFETSAGNWGVSMPALWLKNEQQQAQARLLISDYQQQRQLLQREKYQQLKQAGEHKTIFSALKENPVQFIVYFALVFSVLYFSIKTYWF